MTENKLKALLKDEKFTKAFMAADTPEAMSALLAQEDIDVQPEQAKQIRLFLQKVQKGEIDPGRYVDENGQLKAELTPEELENVAGGTSPLTTFALSAAFISATISIEVSLD